MNILCSGLRFNIYFVEVYFKDLPDMKKKALFCFFFFT